MYFDDKITIKESFISANERIFTNSTDLTKYLLFGDNNEDREYTVVQGDTVESIAEANKLNVDELLVANQNIKSSDALLAIGQKLNVALINPVLTLIYEELVVEDLPSQFQTEYVDDPNQYMGIETVKQEGQDGINRTTYRTQFINGARNQGIKIIGQPIPIKSTQNKIIARGTKRNSTVTGNFVPTNSVWQWPTNVPYVITSGFGWRWGALHEGIDISGTGFGSPIYAALDGNVVAAGWGGMVGNLAGLNVVIQHDNGYYTVYAHMSKVYVSVGQRVARGQAIGGMGMTGAATGVHLHFGLYYGVPYNGGYTLNPMRLWN
jgi:murein DD-endopeptidase MepM/ murein hydrolase activator NlpD